MLVNKRVTELKFGRNWDLGIFVSLFGNDFKVVGASGS